MGRKNLLFWQNKSRKFGDFVMLSSRWTPLHAIKSRQNKTSISLTFPLFTNFPQKVFAMEMDHSISILDLFCPPFQRGKTSQIPNSLLLEQALK